MHSMNNDIAVLHSFLKSLQKGDYEIAESFCSKDIQFYDPLFGYLYRMRVFVMWTLKYKVYGNVISDLEAPVDLGEGYYKVNCNFKITTLPKCEAQALRFHFRIEQGAINEYSEAYSLHQLASKRNGFLGSLLGWNRFYQNNMKIKARKRLFDLMNQQ